MTRLTRNQKKPILQGQQKSLNAKEGEWEAALIAGDLRVKFDGFFAKKNENVNQETISMNPNSSLVSGFDSSTENRGDFKAW
jgi:hypothetical protein